MSAFEQEIDWLKIPALGVMAATHGDWQLWYSRMQSDRFCLSFIDYYFDATVFFDCATAMQFASALPDSVGKANFLLRVASQQAKKQDPNLIAAVRAILPPLNSGNLYARAHPSQVAADAAVLIREHDRELAEQLMFESLWYCEKENRITAFHLTCELATRLSHLDNRLAKVLVTPCFEDWSWLFQFDDSIHYELAPPLLALCAIDTQEAVSRMRGLFSGPLESRPSRKYGIVGGLCRMLLLKSQSLGHPDR
jgi:hypothetical protein